MKRKQEVSNVKRIAPYFFQQQIEEPRQRGHRRPEGIASQERGCSSSTTALSLSLFLSLFAQKLLDLLRFPVYLSTPEKLFALYSEKQGAGVKPPSKERALLSGLGNILPHTRIWSGERPCRRYLQHTGGGLSTVSASATASRILWWQFE